MGRHLSSKYCLLTMVHLVIHILKLYVSQVGYMTTELSTGFLSSSFHLFIFVTRLCSVTVAI